MRPPQAAENGTSALLSCPEALALRRKSEVECAFRTPTIAPSWLLLLFPHKKHAVEMIRHHHRLQQLDAGIALRYLRPATRHDLPKRALAVFRLHFAAHEPTDNRTMFERHQRDHIDTTTAVVPSKAPLKHPVLHLIPPSWLPLLPPCSSQLTPLRLRPAVQFRDTCASEKSQIPPITATMRHS